MFTEVCGQDTSMYCFLIELFVSDATNSLMAKIGTKYLSTFDQSIEY